MKHCVQCHTELATDALFCLKCGKSQACDGEDVLLGTVVAERYLIKARVGSGTSGTVYDARHVTLQKRMAVKFLHHNLCQDATAVERFRREATTVAQLDHPHIIGVQDFGIAADGRLYLAMEFLEGHTLAETLERSAPFTVPRALDIISQVSEALTEAHDRGYVHRDLRPRNIFLISRRGREDFVKVMDFGLAKLVLHELEPGQATVGMSFVEPTYLSPEQAAGEPADRRSDVYALGVMAYEILTGAAPLKGDDVFATINMHLRVKPEPPSRRNRSLPQAFDVPILKALAKKPEDRWGSVDAFKEALLRAAGSTTERGLGAKPGQKRRRDQTEPAIPSRVRESALSPQPDGKEPNVTVLGLGPESRLPPELGKPIFDVETSPAADAVQEPRAAAVSQPCPGAVDEGPRASPQFDDPGPHPGIETAACKTQGQLPERPDGSGPHPILTSGHEEAGARASASSGTPSVGEAALDPTMSQMWYSAGEAEAAQAMAEFEEHLREGSGSGKDLDLTDPVILSSTGDSLFPAAQRRSRRAFLVLLGVIGVVAVVVAVLATRQGRNSAGSPDTSEAASASMPDGGSLAMRVPVRDAAASRGDASLTGLKDSAAPLLADVGPLKVVEMAVQIDAPELDAMTDNREQPRRTTEPMRVREPSDPGRGAEAAQALASGRQALLRGDTAAAQQEFQRALTLRPGNGMALAGLGEVEFELGQYGRAAAHLKAATRAMPSSVKTWVLLGNAYFRSGRHPQARDAFRTALKLSPGHAEAQRNLDLVENRMGM
ncbi:MAG: serine/threonine-protein kinase [Polyangia bacterium]|jgi:serine/threonine protein kinase/tetratricopeptide (TPR) repeat protein|nr:serine/threonine-protein kinase [Polyangia bacterium]